MYCATKPVNMVAIFLSVPSNQLTASPPTHLNQAPPEVLKILEQETTWKFNILELERVTAHR